MLGLNKNIGQYKMQFQEIADKLRSILGQSIIIEHVGSTALDNVDGKGIIDVLIGFKDKKQIEIASKLLVKAGYFVGNHNNPDEGYVFLASTPDETKEGDNHIHLALENSKKFTEYIKLREYFRSNPIKAKEYSDLKYKIAKSSGFQRDKYRQIKSEYIENILKNFSDNKS